MNKKYLFLISLLISLLIILIPVAVATELETYDKVLKTKEEKINLYQNLGDDPYVTDSGQLNDPGQACIEQHKETSSFADSLDSGVISTLEKIAMILFSICTTMSAIDVVISSVAMAVGMISGDFCCTPPMMVCPGPCGAPCTAMSGVYKGWSTIYSFVRPLCCFVNCGWCMGAKTGDTCWGLPFGLEKFALPSYIPDLGISAGLTPEGKRKGGIGQFGLSPYDNIYLAIACLCPVAIMFNLRKLKTIYDVYDCCIQEACANGLSTEACERQLDEATCMYWEGSLYSMLAKILLSLILGFITKVLFENLIKDTFLEGIIMCAYAIFKLTEIPKVIEGVKSAWDYMDRSFGKPNCKDLGFEDVKKEIEYEWIDLTMVDRNKDGVYDYYAKTEKKEILPENVHERSDGSLYWQQPGQINEVDVEWDGSKWIYSSGNKKGQEVPFMKDTPAPVAEKEKPKITPIKSLKKGLKQNYENEAVKMVMYDMIWELFDMTLGEKVDDMIEDKCKEDYEASYPPSDIPSESGGPAECEDTENNVYNAQFISKTEQNDNTCQYKVTYGIGACNHEVNFVVQFQGTGSNENIEGGTLAQGQSVSRKRIITSNLCTHQRICIIIKGEDITKCFPPINQEGGLI